MSNESLSKNILVAQLIGLLSCCCLVVIYLKSSYTCKGRWGSVEGCLGLKKSCSKCAHNSKNSLQYKPLADPS